MTSESSEKTVLFVGQSTGHLSYYESTLRGLARRGYKLALRFDSTFSRGSVGGALLRFREESGCIVKWLEKPPRAYQYFLFFFRELRTYSWYLRRGDQSPYYVSRWADLFGGIAPILKVPLVKRVLSTDFVFRALWKIEKLLPTPSSVIKDILSVAPDLLIVSPGNMRYSSEIDYVKAADKLGITSVVLVFSWDNLTNKGLFHWKPSVFIAWNRIHKSELVDLHTVDPSRIIIVGAQLFDKWKVDCDSVQVARNLEVLTKSKYILYLGSSSNIAEDESNILRSIAEEIKQCNLDLKILFKPHPAYHEKYSSLSIEGVVLIPKSFGLTESLEDIVNFKHLVGRSEFVLGINTSGMLDSIMLGKRTFAFISQEHEQTQQLAAHFKLLATYEVLDGIQSVAEAVRRLYANRQFLENRNKFMEDFIEPNGEKGLAGDQAAEAMARLVR
jgi:hypothetical protein